MDNQTTAGNKTWAITTFYNPEHYKNKLANYKLFRENLKKQNINLAAVECIFEKDAFELSEDDAEILIQVKSKSVLWQKERLLNIALKQIPKECENIVWVDADIIFLKENWVSETEKCLEKNLIVQPFSYSFRLKKLENPDVSVLDKISGDRKKYSYMFCFNTGRKNLLEKSSENGFVWAGKKSIFDACGFYDKHIVGGGDFIMRDAFTNTDNDQSYSKDWSDSIKKLTDGRTGYVDGGLIHLYHGSWKNRYYSERDLILKKNHYNPERDLCLNNDGCWEWSINAPGKLKSEIRKYFSARNENDSLIKNVKYFFYPQKKQIINKIIGLAGARIKNISPKFYNYLKK